MKRSCSTATAVTRSLPLMSAVASHAIAADALQPSSLSSSGAMLTFSTTCAGHRNWKLPTTVAAGVQRRWLATSLPHRAYNPLVKNLNPHTQHTNTLPDDPESYIALSIRSILRRSGPLPLPKLTPMIADDFLEVISSTRGGLPTFLERHRSFTRLVRLPGHIAIAFSAEVSKSFGRPEQLELAMWVMALLSAAYHLPAHPQVVAMRLSTPQPTVEELAVALTPLTSITPPHLELFLKSHPTFFTVVGSTRRVQLLSINAVSLNDQVKRSIVGGLAPRLRAASKSQPTTSPLHVWLRSVAPSQYHVPLAHLLTRARELNMTASLFGEAEEPTLAAVKAAFQSLPAGCVDVRAFGNSPHTVFVRLLNPEPMMLEAGVPTYNAACPAPELETARYNPTRLARAVTDAVAQYAAQSAVARARVAQGLALRNIREVLPPPLMRQIEAFYGFSAQDDPSVSILLLDRVRHLWEVQLGNGTARPWSFLAASELPSSLTLQTSPTPRVVLHFQRLLMECGEQPLTDLYEVLPPDLKTVLLEVYGENALLLSSEDDSTAAAAALLPLPSHDARVIAAVEALVRTHSLFFFQKHGRVYTPRQSTTSANVSVGHAAETAKASPRSGANFEKPWKAGGLRSTSPVRSSALEQLNSRTLTEGQFVKLVHDLIPPGEMVMTESIRQFLFSSQAEWNRKRHAGIPVFTLRRELFARHSRFFKVYYPFGFDKLVVSRSHPPVEETHLLCPRIDNMARLVKYIALLSLTSIADASITRRLPPEGRAFVRQFGTVTDLVERLPTLFAVQREEANFGGSLIRYIGPFAETPRSAFALKPHPTGTLTRKVPNDPFADFPDDNVECGDIDGWNDDWNEDGGADTGFDNYISRDEEGEER